MSTGTHPVLTIGHSAHPLETFVGLLQRHEVNVLADVRSAPYSRFHPQFNRETLAQELERHGIRYFYLGRELGARSDDPSCYENGRVQYERLERSDLFQEGIARVIRGASAYRVALMCAEKEPLECHRTLLVARALVKREVAVKHILADGRLEDHEKTLRRLLEKKGSGGQMDLPLEPQKSESERLEEAVAEQEKRIAYVDERLAAEARGEAP